MSGLLPVERPARLELRRVRVPLVTPFESSHGTESDRHAIVVTAVAEDGLVGWGECDALRHPTYTSEWQDGAFAILVDHLAPAALAGVPSGVRGHPMAAAAVHTAMVDLALRRAGRPLVQALGATPRSVPSTAVVGVAASLDALVAAVATRVERGHPMVKLKVGPGWAVDPVTALRSTWPDLALAVDANGSFVPGEHDPVIQRLDRCGLVYVEQPYAPGDLVDHVDLAARSSTLVALDESAASVDHLRAAVRLGFRGAINLKPARLGGLDETVRAHALVTEWGLEAWCGGMLELGVGRAAALAVAAMPGCGLPCDLGPSASYVAHDIAPAVELSATGELAVPSAPGVGVDPDVERLDAVTVERRALGGP